MPVTRRNHLKDVSQRLTAALRDRRDIAAVRAIVEEYPKVLELPDDEYDVMEEDHAVINGRVFIMYDIDEEQGLGLVPLQKALYYVCEIDVITYLLRQTPTQFGKGRTGRSPLHLTVLYSKFYEGDVNFPQQQQQQQQLVVRQEAVQLLREMIDLYSEDLASGMTYDHELALHVALQHRLPYEVLDLLTTRYPASLTIDDEIIGFPWEIACEELRPALTDDQMLRVLKLLVLPYPHVVTMKRDSFAMDALLMSPEPELQYPKSVRYLLELVYPSLAASPSSSNSWMPVHTVVTQSKVIGFLPHTSAEFLRGVARTFPETLALVDDDGYNAVHRLCNNRWDRSAVSKFKEILALAGPEAVRAKDPTGALPIHKICVVVDGVPKIEAAEALIDAFPDSLDCRDEKGWLPLHVACSQVFRSREEGRDKRFLALLGVADSDDETSLIRCLADRNPESVRTGGSNGELPLHLACGSGKVLIEDIQCLVNHYPKAIQLFPVPKKRKGRDKAVERWYPVFLAAANEHNHDNSNNGSGDDNNKDKGQESLSAIYYLMRQCPEIVFKRYIRRGRSGASCSSGGSSSGRRHGQKKPRMRKSYR